MPPGFFVKGFGVVVDLSTDIVRLFIYLNVFSKDTFAERTSAGTHYQRLRERQGNIGTSFNPVTAGFSKDGGTLLRIFFLFC